MYRINKLITKATTRFQDMTHTKISLKKLRKQKIKGIMKTKVEWSRQDHTELQRFTFTSTKANKKSRLRVGFIQNCPQEFW